MSLKCIFQYGLAMMLVSILCTNISYASEQDRPKLVIGTTTESSPYIIYDKERKGFDTDLFTVIFDRLGYDIEILHGPINRLPNLLNDKQIDVMATWLNPSWSCAKSMPYRYWQNAILTTSNHKINAKKPSDLKGEIVGTYPGASITMFEELGKYVDTFADIIEVPSSDHAAKMLLNNRFYAYIGDVWAVSYFYDIEVKKLKKQPELIVNYLFKPNPQILCFEDAIIRDRFEEELALFKASGEYEALEIKYIPNVASLK